MGKADRGGEPSFADLSGWNRSAGDYALVVMRDPSTGDRVMAEMRWGLRRPGGLGRQLFIRAETLQQQRALQRSRRHRRIIIPMDGYVQRASRGEDKGRYFEIRAVGDLSVAVAGIWEEDEGGLAYAVITQSAKDAIALIHDRMPAVLMPEAWPVWLSDKALPYARFSALLQQTPPKLFSIREIAGKLARHPRSPEQLVLPDLEQAADPRAQDGHRPKAAAAALAQDRRHAVG
jgi:putative SOS response-associated peptidase YedK